MQEADYTKRELDQHFKDLGEKIDYNTTLTKSLNDKVGFQNGRVTKLEEYRKTMVKNISTIGSIVVFLLLIIISLVSFSFKLSQENLRNSILLEIKSK